MGSLVIILSLILLGIVLVQIGKVNELSSAIRGEEETEYRSNNSNALFGLLFVAVFLVLVFASFFYYKNSMLGYGPLKAASLHGGDIDWIFDVTMYVTLIVFVLTHLALFWFAYKYRGRKGLKAKFIPHDNRLELIWMGIPSIVMAFLVVGGLIVWNNVMVDVPLTAIPNKDYIEIEANGQQFGWNLRYPGEDGILGGNYYKEISASNPFGQLWDDEKNHDDFQPDKIVLPVNKMIRVRITARDVLHNFYLPFQRVKMDAVPGMPTHFVFTPTITTEDFRKQLGEVDRNGDPLYPEWHTPSDPEDPDNKYKRYEEFEYILACAELCGKGHFSMKKTVEIVTEEEYQAWLETQNSFYEANIKGKENAPEIGESKSEDTSEDLTTTTRKTIISDIN